MKRYSHIPNVTQYDTNVHLKVTSIDDDDHEMISQKFTNIHS